MVGLTPFVTEFHRSRVSNSDSDSTTPDALFLTIGHDVPGIRVEYTGSTVDRVLKKLFSHPNLPDSAL